MKQRTRFLLCLALLATVLAVAPGAPPATLAAGPAAIDDDATPVLRFDQTRYVASNQPTLRLWDAASNLDPETAETVDVHLFARLTGDTATTQLFETDANSGLFIGAAVLGIEGLAVEPGDLIAALVTLENQPYALTAAVIDGGKGGGEFTYDINPALLPEGMATTPTPQGEQLPVAALATAELGVGFMGQDQLLFGPVPDFLLADFAERRNAGLLATMELPVPPNMDPLQQGEATYHLYRVDPKRFDLEDLPHLMELYGIKGHYTYSSEDAARLLGLLMEEQIAGNAVAPHSLMQYQSAPVSNEGRAAMTGTATRDAFSLPWFNPAAAPANRVRLGETMTLLDVVDARQTFPQVPLAVIDGGFAGPGDYTGGLAGLSNPDLGIAFAAVPQCNIDPFGGGPCGPGVAAGPNPLPCSGSGSCPWHGNDMVSTASAEFNNNFLVAGAPTSAGTGAVGTGAHAASPIFQRVGFPYIGPVASGIARSVAMGARVISISSGFPCGLVLLDWCDPVASGAFFGFLTPFLLIHCGILVAFVPILGPLPCEAIIFALMAVPIQASMLGTSVILAEVADVLIVAAGGNQVSITGVGTFGPFPPAVVKVVPCVMGDVLCVGELITAGGQLTRAPLNAFGAGVDIYAPILTATASPARPFDATATGSSGGTSGSTAFVSGLAAQVRSINPSLPRGLVKQLILDAGCHLSSTALIAGGNCTPTPAFVAFNPNDVPGGYVDALETVHRALSGAGSLPVGLAVCTGGWDERTAAADTPTTAIPLAVTDPGDGILRVTMTGDLSSHRLPSDVDWYRFRLPAGAGSGDARITLTAVGGFGNLTGQLFAGATPISPVFPAGAPFNVSGLVAGVDHFVRVTTAGAANDDNCYGGGSLKIELAVLPAGDWAEANNATGAATNLTNWRHLDWLCTHHMRNRFPPDATTARCPTVFADGPGAARGAVDVWYLDLPPLNVHTINDVDFYRLRLPDIADPAQGGHADIDPDPSVIEPLFECGQTTRQGLNVGGSSDETVMVTGRLQIEIVPRANPTSPRAAAGVPLGLYRPSGSAWLRQDSMGTPASPSLVKVITCPQRDLNLRDLILSVGEGSVPRLSGFATGGYELQVSYQLIASRTVPDLSTIFPGLVGPLPCLRRGGGTGWTFFPNCAPGSPFDMYVVHPFDPLDVEDCIVDGPGCMELWEFQWPATEQPFTLDFEGPDHLGFGLYNEQAELIEEAMPWPLRAGAAGQATLRLDAGDLPPGYYFLGVSGPPGEFDVTFTPPDVPDPTHRLHLPAVRR